MIGWLVGRAAYDDFSLNLDRLSEVREWLTSLGVDPTVMALCMAVTHEPGGYVLHLSEQVRDESGKLRLDVAEDRIPTRPVRIPVEKDSWPSWLNGMRTAS